MAINMMKVAKVGGYILGGVAVVGGAVWAWNRWHAPAETVQQTTQDANGGARVMVEKRRPQVLTPPILRPGLNLGNPVFIRPQLLGRGKPRPAMDSAGRDLAKIYAIERNKSAGEKVVEVGNFYAAAGQQAATDVAGSINTVTSAVKNPFG